MGNLKGSNQSKRYQSNEEDQKRWDWMHKVGHPHPPTPSLDVPSLGVPLPFPSFPYTSKLLSL